MNEPRQRSILELQASQSMNMSIHERAEIGILIVDEIISRYERDTPLALSAVLNDMEGFLSRSPAEIIQAIDLGEAQGKISIDLNSRTMTLV